MIQEKKEVFLLLQKHLVFGNRKVTSKIHTIEHQLVEVANGVDSALILQHLVNLL